MKRFWAWAMLLILSVCLQACSRVSSDSISQEEDEEEVAITIWSYPVGNWGKPSTLSALVSEFRREYPNIHVSIECLDYTTGDEKVIRAAKEGGLPDLIVEGPERISANWGAKGLMADLADLWEEDYSEKVYESVRKASRNLDGSYYFFPMCMSAHCMAINYDMFREAGALQYIDEETRTWSTEDFISAVNALYDYGQKQVAVVYCKDQSGDQGTRALVNNLYGGMYTDEGHTRYIADSEENVKALQLLYDLEGIDFDPDITGADEIDLFCRGELAMAFCWNESAEVAQTIKNPDKDFDIFPMAFPTDSGKPRLQGGIWGFGVFNKKNEAKMEAARTFIRYMTETNAQYTKAVQTSTFWPVRDIGDIYLNDALMTEYSIFTQYLDSYYQITPNWPAARTAWLEMLQKVGDGADIPSALEEFCETANENRNKNKRSE